MLSKNNYYLEKLNNKIKRMNEAANFLYFHLTDKLDKCKKNRREKNILNNILIATHNSLIN